MHLGFTSVSVDGADSKQAHGKQSESFSWESNRDLCENQITSSPEENRLLHEMSEKKILSASSTTTAVIILATVAREQLAGSLVSFLKNKVWLTSLNKDRTALNEPFTKPLPQTATVQSWLSKHD